MNRTSSTRRRLGVAAFAAAAALLLSACVQEGGGGGDEAGTDGEAAGGEASDFQPSGDVDMTVPFAPGGGSDVAGRTMQSAIEEAAEGVTVSVVNREGGSGAVGYSYFLTQEGNEEALMAVETSMVALPVEGNVDFTYEDFTMIYKIGEDFTLAVTQPDSPYDTCADLVTAAESGERVVAGITGQTGLDNVVLSLVEQEAGIEFDRVPFEGGGEVVAGLLGGQIDIGTLNPSEVVGQLEAGDLKPLCVFAPDRYEYEGVSEIPTAEEQGIPVSYAQFRGIIAPGGISDEARDYWVGVMEDVVDTPTYQDYIADNYLQPITAPGDEFAAYLEENTTELRRALEGGQS
jgi:putative tricarboxylic transport membrane protein